MRAVTAYDINTPEDIRNSGKCRKRYTFWSDENEQESNSTGRTETAMAAERDNFWANCIENFRKK